MANNNSLKGYKFKNAVVSFLLTIFFAYIARELINLGYGWSLVIYLYVVSLLMGHITVNTIKPEKKVKVPEKLENFDKFFVIPIVGACEFALYGVLVWILDIFFNFLPPV